MRTYGGQRGLRRFNNVLTLVVVGLGLYLIIVPLLPEVSFWLKKHTGRIPDTVSYSADNTPNTKPTPQDNRLVIPQMDLDAAVNEGPYANTLQKGLWHRPKTSTPDKGGNTVIVGHRFTYQSPSLFYHLDALKTGDQFALFWQGKEYTYTVSEVKTVEPNQLEIEENTTEPTLTLYTCTPMWTAKQRLVIIAKPTEHT